MKINCFLCVFARSVSPSKSEKDTELSTNHKSEEKVEEIKKEPVDEADEPNANSG